MYNFRKAWTKVYHLLYKLSSLLLSFVLNVNDELHETRLSDYILFTIHKWIDFDVKITHIFENIIPPPLCMYQCPVYPTIQVVILPIVYIKENTYTHEYNGKSV